MKYCCTLLLCLGSSLAFGQDVLVLKDGETVEARVLDVRRHDIRFKRFDDLGGPAYVIARRQVARLTYEDLIREAIFTRPAQAPAITQVTDIPLRPLSPPPVPAPAAPSWGVYLRDGLATFRRITPQGLLVRGGSRRH